MRLIQPLRAKPDIKVEFQFTLSCYDMVAPKFPEFCQVCL